MSADLNIAEIPYDSGEIRYRYARVLSADRTRWVRHGLFVEYQRSGAIISEGHYVHGAEQGEWKYFHPNGTLAVSGHYEQGAEHGLWRYWNEAGVEEPSVAFIHGKESGA
jgi:antitoxin component YwqK of YwqJK toxin-antitoxin module